MSYDDYDYDDGDEISFRLINRPIIKSKFSQV